MTYAGIGRAPWWIAAFIVLIAHGLPTSAVADPTVSTDPDFDIDAAVSAAGFRADQVGFLVLDAATGAVLASRNPDRPFIPASVAKVPTAVTVLDLLGSDFRFRTEVVVTGPVIGGIVNGDLYLRGGGDPFLTADHLADLVNQLAALGIRGVAGAYRFDDTFLPSATEIDPGQPDTAAYNPGLAALNINFNIINVAWGREGGELVASATTNTDLREVPASTVVFEPVPEGQRWQHFFTAADDGDQERWWLAPALPAEGEDWLPVRYPAVLAATAFRTLSADAGIILPEPSAGAVPQGAQTIATHRSRPLFEIVRAVLRYSNNLSAEVIGMAASRHLAGMPLPLPQSAANQIAWLADRYPHISWSGAALSNHSGLSTTSRMTPRQIVSLIDAVHDRVHGDGDFAGLLRTVRWEAELNQARDEEGLDPVFIRAKSGTMNYARGLAGVIDHENGRRLIFAVFVNDVERRQQLDAASDDSAREVTGSTRQWLAQARDLERALVEHFASVL